jgi:UDP-arabinose 4-epimerase
MSKRILVTGGAGYVGAHCCKAFAAEGWEVIVFDNLSYGWRDFVRWGALIEGNILDREALARAFASVRPDAVAHFAALASAEGSRSEPGQYYRANVVGTLNLLEAMRIAEVRHLVFSSSGQVYGRSCLSPISEAIAPVPVNPYGWANVFAEQMIRDFAATHRLRTGAPGLNSVSLRYLCAAGADPDDMLGERRSPGRHDIARATAATDPATSYEMTIAGLDHATPDGTSIADFIHVTDVASAHAAALQYLVDGGETRVLNLGSGKGYSVRQIVDAVDRLSGRQVRFRISPRIKSDPSLMVLDPSRARAILSWRTRFSDLDQIVGDALTWHEADAARRNRLKP